MKVLVTGGCGFIGSHVMKELQSRGIEVALFDRNPHDHPQELFLGDVRDEDAVRQALYHSDGVIHLAGILGTQETVNDPTAAVTTNIMGSLNVFKACRDQGKPGVYIAVGNYWMNNPYSITKSTAERFALMANREWGTHIAVVRALNAYGPRQKEAPVRKLMPNLIRAALDAQPFRVYGDGEQIMDMIYVTDVAKILVAALIKSHGVYDRTFEAGTGRPTTVLDVCKEVYLQLGYREPIVMHEPMRPGEQEDSVVLGDPSTLEPLGLNADSLIQLEQGVSQTLDWYRSDGR